MPKAKSTILTDESIMTFGEHKGKKMINVPNDWLMWAKNNVTPKPYSKPLLNYIERNIDVISKNIETDDDEKEDYFPELN